VTGALYFAGTYEIVIEASRTTCGLAARVTALAIQVLPDAFAQDAERLARFEREAKTLASLNHPHFAQIYGLEKSSGVQAIAMELVEGEDLSQRIARERSPWATGR
jgi:serine/threonine protein kinase